MFLAKKDNAKSLITDNPLTSGATTAHLTSGTGSKFPATTDGNWIATIWNATAYPDPSDDPNMEKVLVTARSADTLTITRGYDGTSAAEHAQGSRIQLLALSKHFTEIETAVKIDGLSADTPLDADEFGFWDVADEVLKKITWTNIKATLKTYFDTLYLPHNGWISYSAVTPTRTSVDDPTYVLTFASVNLTSLMSVGMKVKFTQNSATVFGIITAISFSTNTTVTLYCGTDYDVLDTATYPISNFYFSDVKAPVGFPLNDRLWTQETLVTTEYQQANPVSGTWYNLNSALSLSIPIGLWDVEYFTTLTIIDNSGIISCQTTLSTANNSESDSDFSDMQAFQQGNVTSQRNKIPMHRRKTISLSAKTTYYLNARVTSANMDYILINEQFGGITSKTIIRAVCAYL